MMRRVMVIAVSIAALSGTAAVAQEGKESTEGLDMQAARAKDRKSVV